MSLSIIIGCIVAILENNYYGLSKIILLIISTALYGLLLYLLGNKGKMISIGKAIDNMWNEYVSLISSS